MIPRLRARVAGPLPVLLATLAILTAAHAPARAAGVFQDVPLPEPRRESHLIAYSTMVGGAGLIALSFGFTRHADHAYDDYLVATDPARITVLYDRAVHYDRLASGSVLLGETLIATGIYLRFLRNPAERVALVVRPDRCALALRF